ncbi:hypothetical protein PoB_007718600 [Plakobranchus ocellatus]|uniref:Uncharacterized protein n=1 Tax=Plakobranchus ocellatus TaxID=259542 RepID=A0AAV4E4T3_9GAST|nr:hypothetical protein PoB_007718600 [Plakobranchus ocellatus]
MESVRFIAVHKSNNMFGNTLGSLVEHTKYSAKATFILSKRRSYPLCITASHYVSPSVKEKKGECHYVTMYNSSNCCRTNHEASVVTQIIRLTCRWVEHSNCDMSPSGQPLQVASLPMWVNA